MGNSQLDDFNKVWGISYPDKRHPLKAVGWQVDNARKHGRKTVPQCTLEAAFKHWGGTKRDWASACPVKDGRSRGRNTVNLWLKDPGKMSDSDVRHTCELFGCTLDFLRGHAREPWRTADEPPTPQEFASIYARLTRSQRQILASLALELAGKNYHIAQIEEDLDFYMRQNAGNTDC